MAKWRQVKDASTFNDDFQILLLDIRSISIEAKIDLQTRELKLYL